MTPPAAGEFRAGEQFAGYRIEGVVGRGGMGVVYRATELSLGRAIALKVVAPRLVDDALARRRFVREARAAAAIEHPHVIPVHAAGERAGVAFLAMRLIAGDDLRRLVRREGAMAPARAARFVAQIGAALDAAHKVGLVHRDVKPGNVLVAAEDYCYLTDFGLTAFLDSSSSASGSGHWVGTPDFVAPEQIRGERPDARTDVYALGCVLFFLLTGRAPFVREGHEAKLWAHLTEPPPELGIGSPALDGVIARALAKRPDERFASAGDVGRAALAAGAGETNVPEAGSVAVGSAAATEAATQSRTLEAPTIAQPPERRSRRPALIALAATLLVAATVAILVATNASTPPPRPSASATATPTPKPTPTVTQLRRAGAVAAGHRPTSIAIAKNRIWVGERRRSHLRAFEPRTLRPVHSTPLPSGVSQLTATPRGLWASLWRARAIAQIETRTGRISGVPIPVPGTPAVLAIGGGSLYVGLVASPAGAPGTLLRFDLATRALVWSRPLPSQADRLVWLDGELWVMLSTPNQLFRVDPVSASTRQTIDLPGGDADDLTASGHWLWATVRAPDWLVRIDARTTRRADAYVGRNPTGVSVHGNDVWVALWSTSRVILVDARTLRRRAAVDVALNPFMLTADATGAWVVCAGEGRLVHVKKT